MSEEVSIIRTDDIDTGPVMYAKRDVSMVAIHVVGSCITLSYCHSNRFANVWDFFGSSLIVFDITIEIQWIFLDWLFVQTMVHVSLLSNGFPHCLFFCFQGETGKGCLIQ